MGRKARVVFHLGLLVPTKSIYRIVIDTANAENRCPTMYVFIGIAPLVEGNALWGR